MMHAACCMVAGSMPRVLKALMRFQQVVYERRLLVMWNQLALTITNEMVRLHDHQYTDGHCLLCILIACFVAGYCNWVIPTDRARTLFCMLPPE